jgi:predicted DCC family thiol-disulfide oxidoreductase YuxK
MKKKTVKHIEPTTEGKCPFCNKHVQSLHHHIHDKHLGKRA